MHVFTHHSVTDDNVPPSKKPKMSLKDDSDDEGKTDMWLMHNFIYSNISMIVFKMVCMMLLCVCK